MENLEETMFENQSGGFKQIIVFSFISFLINSLFTSNSFYSCIYTPIDTS